MMDMLQKVLDLLEKVAGKVAEALAKVKCCLPMAAQLAMNLAGSVMSLGLCPLWGALEGVVQLMGSAVLVALKKLMKSILPRVSFKVTPWEYHKSLDLEFKPMPECGLQGGLNLKLQAKFSGIDFDTDRLWDSSAEERELNDAGGTIKKAISASCDRALESIKDMFKVCWCDHPVGWISNLLRV